jgi:hypothetical protein
VPLAAGGTATFSTSGLSVGTHTMKASYSGSAGYNPSLGTVQQVIK